MEPTFDSMRDPARDPQLTAALRGALGDAPEIDFEALRGSVLAQAELPLARLRRAGRNPWPARFRTFVPLAAAAGIAGAVLALHGGPPSRPHAPTPNERAQVEQVLNQAMPDLHDMVVGEGGSEQMLNQALGS